MVHFVDDDGVIIGQADYQQDTAHTQVASGIVWRDVIRVPPALRGKVRTIALGLYQATSEPLIADRGPRDWNDHRLLIPIRRDAMETR